MDHGTGCDDEDDEIYNEGINAEGKWNYHDENIPRSDSFIGMGQYSILSNGCQNGKLDFCLKWTDRDTQVVGKRLHDQLLFGLNLFANAEGWNSEYRVTGYTSIKKMDATTSERTLYRSDTNYRGAPWHDWGLFYFDDSVTKPTHSVSMGLILGFVRFDSPGFPTPNNKALYGDEIPTTVTD